LLALDRLPFEEPVHRHDAATHSIGIAERGQIPHALALGVDRLAAALRITAPIRNQTPPQRIERYLAGPVIAADDQQVLARRRVPPRRIVVHAAIDYVHAIDDGIAKRSAALDDPPTHGGGYSYRSARMPARYLAINAPDVGFAPESSQIADVSLGPLRAISSCEQAQHAALIRSPRRRGASSVGGTSRPVPHFARDQKVFHRPPDWVDLVVVVVGWWRTIVSPRRSIVGRWTIVSRGRSIVGRWTIVSRGRSIVGRWIIVSRGRNIVSRGRSVEPR